MLPPAFPPVPDFPPHGFHPNPGKKGIRYAINIIKTTTNFIHPAFGALALAWLALMPMAQAVGPDTEGNIPGANNGEGIGVLVSRTTGIWNTGTGFQALNQLTGGNQNTATGLRALFNDTNGGFNAGTGVFSLYSNTAGFFNSATGAYSLDITRTATAIQPTVTQRSI